LASGLAHHWVAPGDLAATAMKDSPGFIGRWRTSRPGAPSSGYQTLDGAQQRQARHRWDDGPSRWYEGPTPLADRELVSLQVFDQQVKQQAEQQQSHVQMPSWPPGKLRVLNSSAAMAAER